MNRTQVDTSDLILFVVQISIVFILVVVCLINLTLEIGNKLMWTFILSSSIGYLLPNPRLRKMSIREEVFP
jgi:hypothetical protein